MYYIENLTLWRTQLLFWMQSWFMTAIAQKTLSWCVKSWQNSWQRILHCFICLLTCSCQGHTLHSIAWFCDVEKMYPVLWLSSLTPIHPICITSPPLTNSFFSPIDLIIETKNWIHLKGPNIQQIFPFCIESPTSCHTALPLNCMKRFPDWGF